MWYVVLENTREHTANVYAEGSGLTRGKALDIIEQEFESGYLTGEKYQKISLNVWRYSDYKFIRLLNEKGFEQWQSKFLTAQSKN